MRGLLTVALAFSLVAAAAGRVGAVILDSQCIQDDRIAAGLAPFGGNFCTANDLTFVLIGLGIQGDGCVNSNDRAEVLLRAIMENSTANLRYDVALWVDQTAATKRRANSGILCTSDADCGTGACHVRLGACCACGLVQCSRHRAADRAVPPGAFDEPQSLRGRAVPCVAARLVRIRPRPGNAATWVGATGGANSSNATAHAAESAA